MCAETFEAECGCDHKSAENLAVADVDIHDGMNIPAGSGAIIGQAIPETDFTPFGASAENAPVPADPRVSPLNTGLYSPSDTPEMAAEDSGDSSTLIFIDLSGSTGMLRADGKTIKDSFMVDIKKLINPAGRRQGGSERFTIIGFGSNGGDGRLPQPYGQATRIICESATPAEVRKCLKDDYLWSNMGGTQFPSSGMINVIIKEMFSGNMSSYPNKTIILTDAYPADMLRASWDAESFGAENPPVPADPRVSPLNTGLYSPSDTPEMAAEGVSKTQVQIEMGASSGQTEGYRNRIFSVSPINEGDGSIDYLLDDLETLIEERVSGWNATYDYLLNAESFGAETITTTKIDNKGSEWTLQYRQPPIGEQPTEIVATTPTWSHEKKDFSNVFTIYLKRVPDSTSIMPSRQSPTGYWWIASRPAWGEKNIRFTNYDSLWNWIGSDEIYDFPYFAESFGAESKFDKLAKEIAEEYEEKGKSPKEAMEIGEATAANIGRAKFGKRKFAKMGKKAEDDIDFDEAKADRNKDGRISDWERAVGNKVAKGIRESKRAEVGPHVPTRIAATTTPRGVVKTYTSIPAGDGHVIGQFTPDMDYAPSGMYGAESLTSSIEKGFGAVLGIMSGLIVGGFAMGAVSSLSKDDENRE